MEETRVAKNCKGSNNTFIHKISEIIINLYILISFSFFETFILIINSKFSLVIKLKKKNSVLAPGNSQQFSCCLRSLLNSTEPTFLSLHVHDPFSFSPSSYSNHPSLNWDCDTMNSQKLLARLKFTNYGFILELANWFPQNPFCVPLLFHYEWL